jgi:hypothetical protein
MSQRKNPDHGKGAGAIHDWLRKQPVGREFTVQDVWKDVPQVFRWNYATMLQTPMAHGFVVRVRRGVYKYVKKYPLTRPGQWVQRALAEQEALRKKS